ncbi:hypothetical protein SMSP2_02848 [Limihaloglobus sulfuriphilus]|uniref:Uncharacterized protein n=1 Tax=Limihaloglobus sulfuriphilus TaxID=1851148 RepID=A0A1R7T679_9BACT|nr:hypothetical protein [Limihaloglobus sulfuriphilus]AQQ72463.1 hypothetical protein SMSP2_02848 [Limihaloglobus sulfuriphilus]
MRKLKLSIKKIFVPAIVFLLFSGGSELLAKETDTVQASAVLTVAQGKRLIAKAVAQMPEVQKAKKDGMIIITRGTTNTYIAQELTGKKLMPLEFVLGAVFPPDKPAPKRPEQKTDEIVIINGKVDEKISFEDALKQLKPGDVVIKGGNMLDYENKIAGVFIGAPDGGTSGKIMPYVVARKAHLIIPIGLEKQVAGSGLETINRLRQPVESLNYTPSMFLLNGTIVTELEAIDILFGIEAFQAGAGGVAGAEGASWLVFRGQRANVEKANSFITQIQNEPPFMQTSKSSNNSDE